MTWMNVGTANKANHCNFFPFHSQSNKKNCKPSKLKKKKQETCSLKAKIKHWHTFHFFVCQHLNWNCWLGREINVASAELSNKKSPMQKLKKERKHRIKEQVFFVYLIYRFFCYFVNGISTFIHFICLYSSVERKFSKFENFWLTSILKWQCIRNEKFFSKKAL